MYPDKDDAQRCVIEMVQYMARQHETEKEVHPVGDVPDGRKDTKDFKPIQKVPHDEVPKNRRQSRLHAGDGVQGIKKYRRLPEPLRRVHFKR